MNEIVVSDTRLWQDLIEEQKNIDTTIGGNIKEMFAQWLWETGRNLMTSPLVQRVALKTLMTEFAKRTEKKERYIKYSISAYKRFPYTSWEDVLSEIRETHPEQIVSERFFLSLLGNKPEQSATGGELSPLHRGLKNSVEISLGELIQKLKDAEYVVVYSGEYKYSYKLTDKEIETIDLPALPEDNNYNEAKRIVFRFWEIHGGYGQPDRQWIAREIRHAKELLKRGLTEDDIYAIIEWRIADPFWKTKFTSLGLIRTHITDWAIESNNTPKDFESFLNSHPEYDYRKIPTDTDENIYARAEKLKEAIEMARKNRVPISQEAYEKLFRATKIKMEIFEKMKGHR